MLLSGWFFKMILVWGSCVMGWLGGLVGDGVGKGVVRWLGGRCGGG